MEVVLTAGFVRDHTGAAMPYIGLGAQSEGLTDPQGSKVLMKRPCKHPSWRWAKAIKPMIIKSARTHPAATFFIMPATPRG